MIDRGKRSKAPSEVKPVKNKSKNLQSFLETSPMQPFAHFLPSHKLQDHAYKYMNLFGLNEDNPPSQRNCQNQLSYSSSSHIEQEWFKNLIQGKIHTQPNLSKHLED